MVPSSAATIIHPRLVPTKSVSTVSGEIVDCVVTVGTGVGQGWERMHCF